MKPVRPEMLVATRMRDRRAFRPMLVSVILLGLMRDYVRAFPEDGLPPAWIESVRTSSVKSTPSSSL